MSEDRDNIHHFPGGRPPQRTSGNGGGDSTPERLARLEERMNHLATSEKVQETITSIEKLRGEVGILKWIGGLIAGGVIMALFKLYGS